ncbi:MAG: TMEM175 family protein [Methanobrevibacter sp.]|nr:TMEM175 family protein [Methanobrevibacter sp.]
METERFEALIDAVLAIILTIIVLEIPMASNGSWEALFEIRLEFIIYALSFLVIFNFWNYNNNLFSIVNKVNHKVIWLMGLALFLMSFLPYLTTFVAENFDSFIPHALYGLDFLATALVSISIANALKKSDKGNIALQVLLRNHYPLYSTIICMVIGYIIGFFIYPPAITICCLISIPVLWYISRCQFM